MNRMYIEVKVTDDITFDDIASFLLAARDVHAVIHYETTDEFGDLINDDDITRERKS